MKKHIILWLMILGMGLLGIWPVAGQTSTNTTNTEEIYTESHMPRKSLRIIFEGTFRSGKNSGLYPQDSVIQIPDQSGLIQNGLLSTNQLSNTSYYSPYGSYGNYSSSGSKEIMFGFDSSFSNKSGRRFIISSRTRLSSISDMNFKSKETWLQFQTTGPKPSSIVLDFNIRIIR